MIFPASIVRLAARSLSTLCLALAAAHALDLTPQHGFRQGNEGPPTPVIQFADGNGRITYRPPENWQPSGGRDAVTFFTADPTSWMKLALVAQAAPPLPGGATAAPEDLQAWAARFLPAAAQDVEFVKMVPSPFSLGTHASSEFIFNFSQAGSRASISISAIDLSGKERLVVLVCAKAKNFAHIREQAIASMFSWSPEK